MDITLFTRARNSAGERVRIALNLKSVDYKYTVAASLDSNEYLALNPQGLMPVLQVGDKNITQSFAIIELLEELFPDPPLFPSDPILRAKSRAFAQAIGAELHPITVHRIRHHLSNSMNATEETVTNWYHHWTAQTFDALEAILNQRKEQFSFCFADYPTIADLTLIPQLSNARRFDCPLDDYPKLLDVERRCKELPAFSDAATAQQPDYQG